MPLRIEFDHLDPRDGTFLESQRIAEAEASSQFESALRLQALQGCSALNFAPMFAPTFEFASPETSTTASDHHADHDYIDPKLSFKEYEEIFDGEHLKFGPTFAPKQFEFAPKQFEFASPPTPSSTSRTTRNSSTPKTRTAPPPSPSPFRWTRATGPAPPTPRGAAPSRPRSRSSSSGTAAGACSPRS